MSVKLPNSELELTATLATLGIAAAQLQSR
jgi:hypothetical protein